MSKAEAGQGLPKPETMERELFDYELDLMERGLTVPASLILVTENKYLREERDALQEAVSDQDRGNLTSPGLALRIVGDSVALPRRVIKDVGRLFFDLGK